MSEAVWLPDPAGPDAEWTTRRVERTVLVVVHTVTAMNRLADILPVFDADRRVQLVFTFPRASKVTGEVERELLDSGAIVIPWAKVISQRFDLAISVHNSGNLHRIRAPLAVLSHGMGYTKIRRSEDQKSTTYGLSPPWLMRNGVVFPQAIMLSHDEQRERLAAATPQALPRAVVAGDPCYDRISVSAARRSRYRRVLGARSDTTVVVVTSTWGRQSLFGAYPELLSELVAELSLDEHLVAAILHPNIWFAHGPLQIRSWLADARRAGLRIVPPARGWQQTILAADVVIGDHGAVSGYAAAAGIPTMLAIFPESEVAPGSAVARLGGVAARLAHGEPFEPQLRAALRLHDPRRAAEVAELASSEPDRSAQLLRSAFYRLMDLPEPQHEPPVLPYPAGELRPEREPVCATWTACAWEGARVVRLRRWPADVVARRQRGPRAAEAHLVVRADHPRRDLRGAAAIVLLTGRRTGEDVDARLAALLRARPSCVLAAAIDGGRRCRIRHRDGTTLLLRLTGAVIDPAALPSACYGWLIRTGSMADLPEELTVHIGQSSATVSITRLPD